MPWYTRGWEHSNFFCRVFSVVTWIEVVVVMVFYSPHADLDWGVRASWGWGGVVLDSAQNVFAFFLLIW